MPGHVAVIDDEELVRDLIAATLESRYTVSTFSSIAEAREALEENAPDLLIVDVRLADGCGLDLVGTIQSTSGRKVPAIVLSGLREERDFTRAFAAGAVDYMTKPFGRDELLARCAMHLSRVNDGVPTADGLEAEMARPDGLTFGRYRIDREIGRGGFGRVYLAHDTQRNDEVVALKVLAPLWGEAQEARLRFIRETYALASVKAAHVVPVLDVGTFQGRPYFSMKFIPGRGLWDHVRNVGCLDEAEVRLLARGLLSALIALEEAEILHRDIKPENVILRDGNIADPVLIDFGLAKRQLDRGITAPDVLMGTCAYLSPEVIRGRDPDNRSDLFSLGLTLRSALTGEEIFPGLDGVALLTAIATGPIVGPLCTISPGFRRFLSTLVENDPDRRFQSAEDALTALEGLGKPLAGRAPRAAAADAKTVAIAASTDRDSLNGAACVKP
jgi:CheY-like chemotaxis protein